MPTNPTRIGGIVLCGGKSTRMGTPKALLPVGDERMLERVVRLLREVVDPVVVVAAPDQTLPELPPTVPIARDEREARGPLEGLRAGLRQLDGQVEAAYATSCDVPLLVPGFVRRMIELLDSHDIVVPVEQQFHHPLAAVYRASVLPVIEQLLEQDRLRPVFLFDQVDTRRVDVEELRTVDPRLDTLRNLNHPHEYEQALRDLGLK